jgi:hypothetical protein
MRGGGLRFDLKSNFKRIQIVSKFHLSKTGLIQLEKFEIKYRIEGFEERNNFLHRIFFIFEFNFE